MKYYVGAYATSPNVTGWDAELETAYYYELKKLTNMRGLEHPFFGESLHAFDDDWFIKNIDPNWDVVITCIPGVMAAIGQNSEFGLASDSEQGRQLAIDFMKKVHVAMDKLNKALGRQVVKAIQIQTAPNQAKAPSSSDALYKSLTTLLEWDWQGASIVIEHCDAYIKGQTPSKGFLTIEQEIDVVTQLKSEGFSDLGIVINWGRSAIECRDSKGPIEHIHIAKECDVLTGIMFSGASGEESAYGAWQDAHMPPQPKDLNSKGETTSLLTKDEIHQCLKLAGLPEKTLDILGIKIGIRPHETNLQDRVIHIKDALSLLDQFFDL